MVISMVFFGRITSEIELGVSTITGSGVRIVAVSMKKVTRRNARSTIGVISNDGVDRPILIFGISFSV
jgi:hypothetical protein